MLQKSYFRIGCVLLLFLQSLAFRKTNQGHMTGRCILHMSTSVLVIGSTGRTGQRIVEQLVSYDDVLVRAACRAPSVRKAQNLFGKRPKVSITPLQNLANIPDSDADILSLKDELVTAMDGCSTVVCALGALETEALNWKAPYLVDGKLTQIVIDAATRSSTVENFVLVTSLGTDRIGFPASILNLFWGILSWKRQSELKLINSGLKYTIVRPGGMERPTDDFELTHNMKLHPPSSTFGGLVSRKQIAKLCAAACVNPGLATDKILEVTADPEYPKLEPKQLLEALPRTVSDSEWRSKLSGEQFYVLREAGTERPWTSPLNDEKRAGIFKCAGCGTDLFTSNAKFNSGTGWPSFYAPIVKGSVTERTDFLFGMVRTEVLCSNCGGHLGHVFPDGPKPTGLRYCINGVALDFSQRSYVNSDGVNGEKAGAVAAASEDLRSKIASRFEDFC